MSKEFFDAVKAIEAEKGIPAEYLYEKISAAIIVAEKHDYNGKDIVHCDIKNIENARNNVNTGIGSRIRKDTFCCT